MADTRALQPAASRWAPVAALGLFVGVAAIFNIRCTDVFWHLAAGRWILDHGRIPRFDPFRFTSGDAPWVDHEWLFQVLIRGVEIAAGLPGLVALEGALALGLAAVLYGGVRRIGAEVPEAVFLVLIAILGARPRFLGRPEMFTLLAVAILLRLLRGFATDTEQRPWRSVAAMMALTVVWVNFHGAAVLAPVIAALYLAGAIVQRGGAAGADRASFATLGRRALAVVALLGLCLLCNPYGIGLFSVPGGILGAMSDVPAYNPEWVPLWKAPQPFLFGAMAATALLVGFGWLRARRLHLPSAAVTAGLGILALTAVRHQALFLVAAPFLAAETLVLTKSSRAAAVPARSRRAAWLATLACLLAMAWCVFPPSFGPLRPRQGRFVPGFGIEPDHFPEQAAELLAQHAEIGPLFNDFAIGGYMLWRLYPPRQVFIDGRMELRPEILREIAVARSSNHEWNALMERYGTSGALVRIDERRRPVVEPDDSGVPRVVGHSTANALLFPIEDYALVHWDDYSMLFLRRAAPQPRALMAREYRCVQPEDRDSTLERALHDPMLRDLCWREVARKLAEDPDSSRAAELRQALAELPAAQPALR